MKSDTPFCVSTRPASVKKEFKKQECASICITMHYSSGYMSSLWLVARERDANCWCGSNLEACAQASAHEKNDVHELTQLRFFTTSAWPPTSQPMQIFFFFFFFFWRNESHSRHAILLLSDMETQPPHALLWTTAWRSSISCAWIHLTMTHEVSPRFTFLFFCTSRREPYLFSIQPGNWMPTPNFALSRNFPATFDPWGMVGRCWWVGRVMKKFRQKTIGPPEEVSKRPGDNSFKHTLPFENRWANNHQRG